MTDLAKFLPDLSRQQNDQAWINNIRIINATPTAAAFGISGSQEWD